MRAVVSVLLVVVVVGTGLYGWFDVRNRARLDRGTKYHRTDFTVYQYAARALVHDEDPYDARSPRGYRYVYPPLLAVLLMPVADWDPPDAALLWFAVSMLAFAGALVAVARWPFGSAGAPLGWRPAVIAGCAICLGFAHQGFQRGQVTHVLLALQVLAFSALIRKRYATSGLLLAIGIALRLTPALAAGAVGLGLLVGLPKLGRRPVIGYATGLLLGLAMGFIAIPVLALGVERTHELNKRWVEVTSKVYGAPAGELADLEADYKINEFRFKNQAPRRVFATWAGWVSGVAFTKERPDLSSGAWAFVDLAARGLAILVFGFVVGASVFGLAGPPSARGALVFSLAVFVPVLMTRYAWPTHFLMAMPALALALRAPRRGRIAALVFLGGAALFYVAHARPLEWIGAAGCLLIATAAFVVMVGAPLVRRST